MGQILPFQPEPENELPTPEPRASQRNYYSTAAPFDYNDYGHYSFSARRALAKADDAMIKMEAYQEFRDLLDSYAPIIIGLATVAVFALAMSLRMESMMDVYVMTRMGVWRSVLDGVTGGILPAIFTFVAGILINGALHEAAQRRYEATIDDEKIPAEDRFEKLTGFRAPTYDEDERYLAFLRQNIKGEKELERANATEAKHFRRRFPR